MSIYHEHRAGRISPRTSVNATVHVLGERRLAAETARCASVVTTIWRFINQIIITIIIMWLTLWCIVFFPADGK